MTHAQSNLHPIMAQALRGVVPPKLADAISANAVAAVRRKQRVADRLMAALERKGITLRDEKPGDLSVTIDIGPFECSMSVGTDTCADDDGCGSPTTTGNGMTGRRGGKRRVWDGTGGFTPEEAAELIDAARSYVIETCDAEIQDAIDGM